MSILLITLFFGSLLGIIIVIGRKLTIIRENGIIEASIKHPHPFVPEIQKIKYLAFRNAKKYEHLALVAIIKFYLEFSKFFKNSYQKIKITAKDKWSKYISHSSSDISERQTSKFLKMISGYKDRIKHIKYKIKNGEEIK